MELERIYKKNALFIILIGITGFCFGLLDWDSNLADLVYLKYNNVFLISVVSANIGTARLIATLFCIKINTSQRPNFVFISCMIVCSIIAIITAICFDAQLIILFVITYLIEVLVLEIFLDIIMHMHITLYQKKKQWMHILKEYQYLSFYKQEE